MGIITITTLLVTGAGAFMLWRLIPGISPGEKRVQKDFKTLKREIKDAPLDLVPISKKELDLLSPRVFNLKGRKRKSGYFGTVFEEPVAQFAGIRYGTAHNDFAWVVQLANIEILFWRKKKQTRLVIDKTFIGIIDEWGNLKSPKGELLAQVQKLKGEYIPVMMQGIEVAGVFNPTKNAAGELTSRMFHFIDNQLEGNQLVLVLALTYFIFLRSVMVV